MYANFCRNCCSSNVLTSKTGLLAPFFVNRVYGIHVPTFDEFIKTRLMGREGIVVSFLSVLLRVARLTPLIKNILNIRVCPVVNISVCKSCGFVGPEQTYPYEMLKGLYHDYRSDDYNLVRASYEEYYKNIQDLVGKDPAELAFRLKNVDLILKKYVNVDDVETILDWGGGEGRFIPSSLIDKDVVILDVSNEPLVNSAFVRVSEPPAYRKFDFIQVCHLLEHVSEPVAFMQNILNSLKDGGYIYIEVPQDRTDEDIRKFQSDPSQMSHVIHEHLNLFCEESVSALGNALNLSTIYVGSETMNFGWNKGKIVSGLFKKV